MFTAHESHQTLPPISKPGRTSFQAFPRAPKRELTSKISTLFLISNFPPELRNELYAHYFASLQPLRITSENVSSPLHKETQLSLSSPFFESDIWPKYLLLELYFLILKSDDSQAICPRRRKRQSAKVRIDYGRLLRCHHTDWIFLLFQYFLTLKEVTFVLGTNGQLVDRNFFGQWWSCVRDATREAANSRVEDTKERNTGVLLKVECGDWTISEIVGGLGK
ncbi:hypothetical protein L207DRAFT_511486 [Hyaloscypha variabilis F]|uniref:Uncharacterized protein n=1 Tax=Hyaloscypha variabilis (strain UAMH 11265 / GT02V1 / F) TaxID=1149755 RepID=A0A2J6RT29_HYAVF|nr:hypothetical protein L207DRAFT_511486 [Hyaloscypha variabilis F]